MALKKLEEFGDDLVVLFVEVQGADMDRVTSFALGQKWLGRGGIWTTDRPFGTGSAGIPDYALLGADGKVLMKGSPLADASKIHDAIEAEIRGARAGEEVPKEIEKAWKDFSKGKIGEAIAALDQLATGEDAELGAAASKALTRMRSNVAGRVGQLEWLLENGRYEELEGRLKDATKDLKGVESVSERLAAVATALKDKELKPEIDAEKKLLKIEKILFAEGPDPGIAKKLQSFVEKNEGTKAATRAAFWLKHATSAE